MALVSLPVRLWRDAGLGDGTHWRAFWCLVDAAWPAVGVAGWLVVASGGAVFGGAWWLIAAWRWFSRWRVVGVSVVGLCCGGGLRSVVGVVGGVFGGPASCGLCPCSGGLLLARSGGCSLFRLATVVGIWDAVGMCVPSFWRVCCGVPRVVWCGLLCWSGACLWFSGGWFGVVLPPPRLGVRWQYLWLWCSAVRWLSF